MKKKNTRGFTIFFAVLVGSLALAIGLSIYELLIRELALSQIATQSQYAIYAADAGAECALYWDGRYNGTSSAFATSSDTNNIASGIICTALGAGSHDIAANGWLASLNVNNPPTLTSTQLPGTWGVWNEVTTASTATTTFLVLLGSTVNSPCAKVTMGKSGNPTITTLISRGYNTCSASTFTRVERAFQVRY
jgi:hypothetical protein